MPLAAIKVRESLNYVKKLWNHQIFFFSFGGVHIQPTAGYRSFWGLSHSPLRLTDVLTLDSFEKIYERLLNRLTREQQQTCKKRLRTFTWYIPNTSLTLLSLASILSFLNNNTTVQQVQYNKFM